MKGLARAIHMLLALKCDESTRLISDEFERELSPLERWAVRLHFISCSACRRFKKQLRWLHEMIAARAESSESLPPDARQRIARTLEKGPG